MSYNNYLPSLILLKMINSMQSCTRGVILKRGAILEQAGIVIFALERLPNDSRDYCHDYISGIGRLLLLKE